MSVAVVLRIVWGEGKKKSGREENLVTLAMWLDRITTAENGI